MYNAPCTTLKENLVPEGVSGLIRIMSKYAYILLMQEIIIPVYPHLLTSSFAPFGPLGSFQFLL
jgi:hypothetical protein